MAIDSEKKVTNEATETRTAFIPITNCTPIPTYQCCLLCENVREVSYSYGNRYPWVCNECKEAIVFVKDLRNTTKEVLE